MTDRKSNVNPASEGHALFHRLYSSHHRKVLAYCARRTSREDAWDAASEVFVVAWRRLDDLPPEDETLAWLLGVAYRILANQRRTARRRRRLHERAAIAGTETVPRPDELLVRHEEETRVIEALSRLRPADREIILLTLWEELSPPEIAEILGISRAAVDQRYFRAKQRLARELNRNRVLGKRATQVTTEKGGSA